ncbi:MAG: type II toxin-antitoxin system RelE/ParE family toxin [Acidimicrobiales bacterium]|nr:MAG: type II toxin-antitoxin system RelE/ParE family toxin [Acidimicrobiales bacterium]
MPTRSVRLRERAAADIDRAVDFYLAEADTEVALRFVDAVARAVGQISRSPQSGSLQFSYELEIPGLRVRPLARFPYLVFYVVVDDVVDVWRILHTRRDIPSAIGDQIGT